MPVVVRTVLNLQRDTLAYWQGMSCLFNKWWYAEKDRVTLPFCFFHIAQYSEIAQAETSNQRVILYEPPGEEERAEKNNDPLRRGLMQVITDNIVLQPQEYKMNIIVPYLPFGNYIRHGIHIIDALNKTLDAFADPNEQGGGATVGYIREQLDSLLGASGYFGKATKAYNSLNGFIEQEISNVLNSDAMVNKASLDAMFRSGAILKLKTWMGFDYKYVVITNKTAEKRAGEDDVWRVELTVKEMPVLSLSPVVGNVKAVSRPWVLNGVNRLGDLMFNTPRVSLDIPALAGEEGEDGTDADA
jgi:hypothetical protein